MRLRTKINTEKLTPLIFKLPTDEEPGVSSFSGLTFGAVFEAGMIVCDAGTKFASKVVLYKFSQ